MKKVFLQQAYEEINDAVEYYEDEQVGLGLRMMEEFDKHVQWIMQNSTVPHIRTGGYHREIDFIIQRGDELVALEVKAAHTVTRKDFTHIEDLRRSMPGLKHGIVLYQGEEVIPFGGNYAIPLGSFCKE